MQEERQHCEKDREWRRLDHRDRALGAVAWNLKRVSVGDQEADYPERTNDEWLVELELPQVRMPEHDKGDIAGERANEEVRRCKNHPAFAEAQREAAPRGGCVGLGEARRGLVRRPELVSLQQSEP